jgi:hypothetical protein
MADGRMHLATLGFEDLEGRNFGLLCALPWIFLERIGEDMKTPA